MVSKATVRRYVLKALVAVGCRGTRNNHDITHVDLHSFRNQKAFCLAIAGDDEWPLLYSELFRHYPSRSGLSVEYRLRDNIVTIADLVMAVHTIYPR